MTVRRPSRDVESPGISMHRLASELAVTCIVPLLAIDFLQKQNPTCSSEWWLLQAVHSWLADVRYSAQAQQDCIHSNSIWCLSIATPKRGRMWSDEPCVHVQVQSPKVTRSG